MSSSSKDKPKTFRLFVESPTGVVEYVVGVMPAEEGPMVTSLAGRVASGQAVNLSRATLERAIRLEQWASTHADVFREGRVVPDP
jgi:hypothetical protein